MKKSSVLYASLFMVIAFASCGSSESAYKKAYEKAKAQEATQITPATQAPVVAPLIQAPVTQATVVDNVDNATVRSEDLTVISGSGLNVYSVVVGSFGLKANAEGLQSRLQSAGYQAQLGYNSARSMYRVIATTYADKASAVASRDLLRTQFPDAWLLYKK